MIPEPGIMVEWQTLFFSIRQLLANFNFNSRLQNNKKGLYVNPFDYTFI